MEASLYRATGGFDEDFGEAAFEDMEFFERLKCAGVQPLFVPEATVEHPARILTLKQWWARSLRIRWYSLYLLKVRPGAIQQNGATALVSVLVERSANLLRTVLRQSREFQSAEWLRSAFLPLWELASFPLLLPWVLYWEVRFRRLLRNNRAERLLANDRAQPLSSEA
jgi:GT2 family glycosyltransferase